jgi:hypothetical protein
MSNGENPKRPLFEPDNATTQKEKRIRLIELLTGVWQFHDTLKIERLDTDTHKGWDITVKK